MSQPALSQRIKALEEDIGAALFERSRQGVALTPAGDVFLRGSRKILHEVDLAVSSARLADRGENGNLTIAFNEIAGQQPLFARCLGLFRSAFPNVGLELSEMGTATQVDALRAGAIDIGFHYRVPGAEGGVAQRVLDESPFMLVVPEAHALARQASVAVEDLVEQPMVRLRREVNADTHDGIVQALAAHHVRQRIVVEASSDAAMLSLVSAGVGVAIVMGAQRRGGWEGLALRPIAGLALAKQFVLAWNAERRSGLVDKFLALVDRAVDPSSEEPQA